MALGDFTIFNWKGKEQKDREQREYEKWAFPHGELQRGNLEALMAKLCPKEDKSFFLMSYLTCKELYERYLGSLGTKEEAVDYLLNKEKKYRNLVKKKDMPCCIALVLADTEVDESCTYPTADELRESIAEIEALRIKK